MLILRVLFLHEWSDFYSVDAPKETNLTRSNQNSNKDYNTNTYIKNSVFTECSDSGSGGCIYFSGIDKYLLVEFSAFYLCHASSKGGCVYPEDGHCVINCVCCLKCYADSRGQSIYTLPSSSNKNHVIQSSICLNSQTAKGYSPIDLRSGYENCSLVNLSNNYVKYYQSAICLVSGSSDQLVVEYCSINSNEAYTSECLACGNADHSYKIEMSNIINNTQDSSDYGTFYCEKPTEIIDCCILENSGQVDSYRLFYASGCTITVTNCTLSAKFNHNAGVTTSSASASKSFIHGFTLTESGTYCEAGPDSVGDLTPVPQLPDQTPDPTVSMSPFPTLTETPNASPFPTMTIEPTPTQFVYRNTCERDALVFSRMGSVGLCSTFICCYRC